MNENELSKIIVDKVFHIHKKIGPGLFESVYETILTHELLTVGLQVERQKIYSVKYEGLLLKKAFIADLVIENKVILELKAQEILSPIAKKQLLTYLRLADLRLGLLINFGTKLIKNGIYRIVNKLDD